MNLLERKRTLSPEQRWIFSREELQHLPSIRDGMRPEEEMEGRRRASEFIHAMSDILNRNRLDNSKGKISKLCMSVAMAHLHRFFCIHSMRVFDPADIAAACLFLASKSEECCRKLADFAQAWWEAKGRDPQQMLEQRQLEEGSAYMALLEGFLLQTVGFSLHIEIPHSIVLRTVNTHKQIRLKNAHKIGSIAYEFCTFALEKMNWFVRYRVRTIAMVCLALAWSWSPDSEAEKLSSSSAGGGETGATSEENDAQPWYMSIEPNVPEELLSELMNELIATRDRLRQQGPSSKKPLNYNPPTTVREDTAGEARPSANAPPQPSRVERPDRGQDRPLGSTAREVKIEVKVEEVANAEAGTPPVPTVDAIAGVAQQKSQRRLALSEYLGRKKESAVPTAPSDGVIIDTNTPCEPGSANNAQHSSPSSTASSCFTATGSVDGKLAADQGTLGTHVKTSPPPPPPQRRSFIPTVDDLSGRAIHEMSLELPAGIKMVEQLRKPPPVMSRSQHGAPPHGSRSPSSRKHSNNHRHAGDAERRTKGSHMAEREGHNASKECDSPSKRSSPEKGRQASAHREEQRRTHHYHRHSQPAEGDDHLRPSHHRQHHGSEESLRRKVPTSHSHGVTTSTSEHPSSRSQQLPRKSQPRYSDWDAVSTGVDTADSETASQASPGEKFSTRTARRGSSETTTCSTYGSVPVKRWRGDGTFESIGSNPLLPPDDPHDLQQPPPPPSLLPPAPGFSDDGELEEGELR